MGKLYEVDSLEFAGIEVGDRSPRLECPACRGGATRELSFQGTRVSSSSVYYWCYRASCGIKGVVGGGTSGPQGETKRKRALVRPVLAPLTTLTSEEQVLLEAYLKVPIPYLLGEGVMLDPNNKRVALPIYDSSGDGQGHVLRYFSGISDGSKSPKALTRRSNDYQGVAYTSPVYSARRLPGTLVLVEDWPSANRLTAAGVRSAALLGTHISQEALYEILKSGVTRIILSLDADAHLTALRHKLKYSSIFCDFLVKTVSNIDIKDLSQEHFIELVEELCNM